MPAAVTSSPISSGLIALSTSGRSSVSVPISPSISRRRVCSLGRARGRWASSHCALLLVGWPAGQQPNLLHVAEGPRGDHPSRVQPTSSDGGCPTSRASTCSRTMTAGALRRQGDARSASGSRRHFSGPHRGGLDVHRPGRLDRLPGHRDRGRGAARRAAVHQAPPPALQHPAARRQVLSRTSASASTRSSRASTSPASATARGASTSGPSRAPAGSARRSTCSGKLFQYRTCEGPEPGRRSGVPCLDYYIKRCQAPCVGYIDREEYRRNIEAIVDFLSGRYRDVERDLERKMAEAAGAEEFERAAIYRDRLEAVRSLMQRRSVAGESLETADLIAVAVEGNERERAGASRSATGCSPSATASTSPTRASAARRRSPRSSSRSTTPPSPAVPRLVVVGPALRDRTELLAEALSARRGGPVEVRVAERGDKRRLRELAERNARLALAQDKLRPERRRAAARRRARRASGGARARLAAGPDRGVRHLEPRPRAHGGLDGRVRGQERRRSPTTGGSRSAAIAPTARTTSPRSRRSWGGGRRDCSSRRIARRTMPSATRASPRCPDLIVIDGGKGQLSAGMRALEPLVERGTAVIGLAKRLEEVFVPGAVEPAGRSRRTPRRCGCCSGSATRRTASRSTSTGSGATRR